MNTPSSVAPATSAAGPRPGSVRGWKATIAVAMSNYIEAGSIIALATSLTLWQEYFGFSNWVVGLVAALSANAFGAAIGALIGGPLGDRYGRKFIYTYDLILLHAGNTDRGVRRPAGDARDRRDSHRHRRRCGGPGCVDVYR